MDAFGLLWTTGAGPKPWRWAGVSRQGGDLEAEAAIQARQHQVDPDLAASTAIVERLARVAGIRLSWKKRAAARRAIPYLYGTAAGGTYGVLAESMPALKRGYGVLFGLVLWVGEMGVGLSLLDLAKGPAAYSLGEHVFNGASHIVFWGRGGSSAEDYCRSGMIRIMRTIDVFPPRAVLKPIMYQDWESLTFLHWRYDADSLRRLLPAGIELDLFEGSAWIGLVPFRMANVRAPRIPTLGWLSNFPETNVRTYVRGCGGERGIWFFSLEAARLPAVLGGRTLFGLPYRWASMRVAVSGDVVEYRSLRFGGWPAAKSQARIRVGEPIEPSDLEAFLTARFRLYTKVQGKLAYADVEHEPWPLRKAEILQLKQDLIERSGVPKPAGDPLAHFSPGVHVRIGAPQTES